MLEHRTVAERPNVIDVAQRTAAKVAALAYLIPVAFIIYANFGLRGRLFVRADIMEPTRLTVCAIMAPRRAAHLNRWTDGETTTP